MAEKKATSKAVATKKAEPKAKAEPKKVVAKPATKKAETVKKTETVETPKKRIERYHVSLDKKDGKWKVFLAGSTKVIKKFDTQLQAYGYAQNLSEVNDRGIVVHSKKGKTRKM